MNDLKLKNYEVLVSIIVESFNPQDAASIVKESLHTSPLIRHSHMIDAHIIELPHRRQSDNRHEIQLDVGVPVILKLESTGSGASLNEPSIPLESLTDYTSKAVKE